MREIRRPVAMWCLGLVLAALCGACDDAGGGDADADTDADTDADADTDTDTGPLAPVTCPDGASCYTFTYQLYGEFDLHASSKINLTPFPYDFFTVPDPATGTGLRYDLDTPRSERYPVANTRSADEALRLLDPEGMTAAINQLDGASAFPYILLETGAEIDQSTLPATPEASVAADAPLLLLDVDPDSPEYGARIPYAATARRACGLVTGEPDGCEHLFWYLSLKVDRTLLQRTRYALVVTTRLRSAVGEQPLMSPHFQEVWGVREIDPDGHGAEVRAAERERLAPLRAALDDLGAVPPGALVLAVDFTTQSTHADLQYIADEFVPAAEVAPPDLDFDGDGVANVYPPDAWPAHLPARPNTDYSHVAYLAAGTLAVPEFRHFREPEYEDQPRYSTFVHDAQFHPVPNGSNELSFWLYLPDAPTPMPLALVQHGIGNNKEGVARLAGTLAEQGIASIFFDFPYHGSRKEGMEALEFIDVFNLTKAACAFKQATAEHLFILEALARGAFDDVAEFDPQKLGYTGTSLGSIVGETSVALSPHVSAAVLNVGGSGLMDFVSGFLEDYGLVGTVPDYVLQQAAAGAQMLLDSGDSVNFLPRLVQRHEAGELTYLFQQVMDDDTIPLAFSLNFSRQARPVQVEPVQLGIPGLTSAPAPYDGGRALFQFPQGGHSFLFSGSEAGQRGRAQYAEFFRSAFETAGPAEVIDPFAE